ncbi:MAG: DNA polymerase III subunit alpha [Arenicella sp.]
MPENFVHLRLHSEYSLANGIVRIPALIDRCAEMGMPSVALTDLTNFYGLVKFFKKTKVQGLKPVFGVDLWIENLEKPAEPFPLCLLVQNAEGYKNACVLISKSYQQGQDFNKAITKREWLKQNSGGLIALSGGMRGELGQALLADSKKISDIVHDIKLLFPGRFYIELHRTAKPRQEEYLALAVQCAHDHQLPVVATNEVHFIDKEDYDSHEVRVCIHEGYTINDKRRAQEFTEEQYLKSPEEMCALFSDIPSAIENTLEIAKRCTFSLEIGDYHLPEFPVPEGETIESHLRNESYAGLERILARLGDAAEQQRPVYKDRMEFELGIINQMGYPGYFLIVADFIRWSKENDVPVGPGRGSGAASIVAASLGITDLDPIKYELLFERFLNPERVSMPDFDVDFCVKGRERVIQYVTQHYGVDKVSQIITYGTMAAKAVVRDVGRVMGMPYGFVDRIAKLIPFDVGIKLRTALEQEEELQKRYQSEDEVAELIDMALSLEGTSRNVGKHAGGVVIAPTDLTDFTPLYCESNGAPIVSQYDKDDLEDVGLVKFDFLGLKNLTIIDAAVKDLNAKRVHRGQEAVDIAMLPLDDPEVYKFLRTGLTTAIFQLESPGMKKLVQALEIENFDEIVALLSLYRPGPLGAQMDQTFVNRKHGREPIVYDHEILEPILRSTYGVIVYQEQVMQVAQDMAGYTLGGADMLRRAMGKKKPEEMAKQREIFLKGAAEKNIDPDISGSVFDLMEKFAAYGFNKAHSAAYAVISYQTAWLKTHYPSEFLAASMSEDMDSTDRIVIYLNEANELSIKVTPPNINECNYRFRSRDSGEIVYGLGAVKGVGQAVLEHLVEEREQNGLYESLFDLCYRVDIKKVNRRALQALTKAGAFDAFGDHRASIFESIDLALEAASQRAKSQEAGQNELFAVVAPEQSVQSLKHADPWEENELLSYEKENLGLYLSGHPIDVHLSELRKVAGTPLLDVNVEFGKKSVTIAGLIVESRIKMTKRGAKMGFITLDDQSARIEVVAYQEQLDEYSELIRTDEIVIVKAMVSRNPHTDVLRVAAESFYSLDTVRSELASCLTINLDVGQIDQVFLDELKKMLSPNQSAQCAVNIFMNTAEVSVNLVADFDWRVKPTAEMLASLKQLLGADSFKLEY